MKRFFQIMSMIALVTASLTVTSCANKKCSQYDNNETECLNLKDKEGKAKCVYADNKCTEAAK